jgi:hypothetical protein
MSEPVIGSTVWVHSEYESALGRMVEAERFHIVGETARSWKISWKPGPSGIQANEFFTVQKKADAKGEHWTAKLRERHGARWRVYLTREELDAARALELQAQERRRWLAAHHGKIADAVTRCWDQQVLAQVAALVGYKL